MNCATCGDCIADFLLEELPESEAVLVQEHLALCPTCSRAFHELKGTGKALEAVPAMCGVTGSTAFVTRLRENAALESAKIVLNLPPEVRLRTEARKAARKASRKSPQMVEKTGTWRYGAIAAALFLASGLVFILTPSRKNNPIPPSLVPGVLRVARGDVQCMRGDSRGIAEGGKRVEERDRFQSSTESGARFDFDGNGEALLGPSSKITFKNLSASGPVVFLEEGCLGARLPPALTGGPSCEWEVQSKAYRILLSTGTHAFIVVTDTGNDARLEIMVLSGKARVFKHSGQSVATAASGQKLTLAPSLEGAQAEDIRDAEPPGWAADLSGN
jgi:hypothetical protein